MHILQIKRLSYQIHKQDLISNGTNVAINHHYQQMAGMWHAQVHIVLLSVQLDGDHKVDGESNARTTTHGRIQDSHHA
jgi:hypothetical protein